MAESFPRRLQQLITAITRGDYGVGKEIDRLVTEKNLSVDEQNLAESVGFMTVKLEAREIALQDSIEDLRAKNACLAEAIRNRELFSTLFVSLFLSVSLYVFLAFASKSLGFGGEYSARVVELLFLTTCLWLIYRGGFHFSFFGLTLQGAKKSIFAMLPGTIIFCILLVGLKYAFVSLDRTGFDGPVFLAEKVDFLFIIYVPVVVLQEFLARGVIQTVVEHVLARKGARFWSIMTTSALFGLVHIELSVAVAFASFVCSIYWGYVYTKSRTLVGVSLSHLLIGDLAYVLGFWDFLLGI